MKIGMVTDSLGHLSLDDMLDTAARLGIMGVEFNAANWTSAPHLNLQALLDSPAERRDLVKSVKSRGLDIIALNANGNQLHPTEGDTQSKALHDTIRVAGSLGIETVVLMSGLPEGAAGDKMPNWVVSSWPPETQTMLKYQWEERALPYWAKFAAFAKEHGVKKLAVELHGNQLVYNVPTLLRLRKEIGPIVGANLDPSHLMWMGADPLAAIDALGSAILHTHAKLIPILGNPLVSQVRNLNAGSADQRPYQIASPSPRRPLLRRGVSPARVRGQWRQFLVRRAADGV